MSVVRLSGSGFTLTEIVVVMVLLSILAAVAVPNFIDLRTDAKSAITKDEMMMLKRGIVGDGRVVSGGQYAFPGYEADNGAPPIALTSLASQPIGISTYDPITRAGWRGPYVDTSAVSDYTQDAWGVSFVFSTNPRFIRSWGPNKTNNSGGGDDIDVTY